MKTLTRFIVPVVFATVFTSCIFSLHPIYTEDTLVFDKKLEGTWKISDDHVISIKRKISDDFKVEINPSENEFIVVNGDTIRDQEYIKNYFETELRNSIAAMVPSANEGYQFERYVEGDTLSYLAKMADIDGQLYLDLYPDKDKMEMELSARNYFPVHTFIKVDIEDDKLILTEFKVSKLKDLFKSNQIRLRHEQVDGNILITAQPEQLQKFISTYSRNEDVFQTPEVYKKVNI